MKPTRSAALVMWLAFASSSHTLAGCGSAGDAPAASDFFDASQSAADSSQANDAGLDMTRTDAPEDTATLGNPFGADARTREIEAPDAGATDRDGTANNRESDANVLEIRTGDVGEVDASMQDGGVQEGGPWIVDAMTSIVFPSAGTTQSILSGQGSDCFACAERSGCLDSTLQGGTCEETLGDSSAACAAPLGLTSTPSEALVCVATLSAIFTSRCITALQETPCLCGSTDPSVCVGGAAAPTGALAPLYACDLERPNAHTTTNFTNQVFGSGQANALVQCLAIFNCDCFP
jgi:hypothetical protein